MGLCIQPKSDLITCLNLILDSVLQTSEGTKPKTHHTHRKIPSKQPTPTPTTIATTTNEQHSSSISWQNTYKNPLGRRKQIELWTPYSKNFSIITHSHSHTPHQTQFTIPKISDHLSLTHRLTTREKVAPVELDIALETRSRLHRSGAPYSPVYPTVGRLFP